MSIRQAFPQSDQIIDHLNKVFCTSRHLRLQAEAYAWYTCSCLQIRCKILNILSSFSGMLSILASQSSTHYSMMLRKFWLLTISASVSDCALSVRQHLHRNWVIYFRYWNLIYKDEQVHAYPSEILKLSSIQDNVGIQGGNEMLQNFIRDGMTLCKVTKKLII